MMYSCMYATEMVQIYQISHSYCHPKIITAKYSDKVCTPVTLILLNQVHVRSV